MDFLPVSRIDVSIGFLPVENTCERKGLCKIIDVANKALSSGLSQNVAATLKAEVISSCIMFHTGVKYYDYCPPPPKWWHHSVNIQVENPSPLLCKWSREQAPAHGGGPFFIAVSLELWFWGWGGSQKMSQQKEECWYYQHLFQGIPGEGEVGTVLAIGVYKGARHDHLGTV